MIVNRTSPLFFHFSNDVGHLVQALSERLKACSVFEKVYITVPAPQSKYDLQKKISDLNGICMGVEFASLQPLLMQLVKRFFPSIHVESHLELALRIQLKIHQWVVEKNRDPSLAPLFKYVEASLDAGIYNNEKLTALSDHLASLFVTYALYCPNLEDQWDRHLQGHWQRQVWKAVVKPGQYIHNPQCILDLNAKPIDDPWRLFIFDPTFLPNPYLQLLQKLGDQVHIEFFQRSHCSSYWADIHSSKESSRLLSFFKKKGASLDEVENLQGYLKTANSLLANMGKLGREWVKSLDSIELESSEGYLACEKARIDNRYLELVGPAATFFDDSSMSLLKYVQHDVLWMYGENEKKDLPRDASIQLHQASTPAREIEQLFFSIQNLLEKKPHLNPSDICVYVANLESYIPYIQTTFQNSLDYCIYGASFQSQNTTLRAVILLGKLLHSRFEKETLLELFNLPAFKRRFHLSSEMLNDWEQWMDQEGVVWGYNSHVQEGALQGKYDIPPSQYNLPSWQACIDGLIEQLCLGEGKSFFSKKNGPLDFSHADSLSAFIEILQLIQQDFLSESQLGFLPLKEWAFKHQEMINRYFLFEGHELEELSCIEARLKGFQQEKDLLDKERVSLETFHYYFGKELEQLELTKGSSQLNRITFQSIFNCFVSDAKAVYIVGLNEDVFPRVIEENPLTVLKQFQSVNFCPQPMDHDRYLFLSLLLSAKEFFSVSFLGYCIQTFKQKQPSILISELLNYCDQQYTFSKSPPSQFLVEKHSHLSFDAHYFKGRHFLDKSYKLALSYYHKKERCELGFRSYVLTTKPLSISISDRSEKKRVSADQLASLARNPIQFTLQKAHQIYLEPGKVTHDDQHFYLSALQRALLKNKLVETEKGINEKELPQGVFGHLEKQNLCKEKEQVQHFFKENQIYPLMNIELREDIDSLTPFKEGHWLMPPIEVTMRGGRVVLIHGTIKGISEKGFISTKAANKETVFKDLPLFLIYSILMQERGLNLSPNWFFCKDFKQKRHELKDPRKLLGQYLEFYEVCLENVVPLLPSWIPYFIEDSPPVILNKIKKDLSSDRFYNLYAQMLLKEDLLSEHLIERWKKMCIDLLKPLYEVVCL